MQKTNKLLIGIIACCLILLLAWRVPTSFAGVVWSDNFDNGLDDWTIREGNISTASGCLEVTGSELCTVEHASSIAYGSWSFDLYLNDSIGTLKDKVLIILAADEILCEGGYFLNEIVNGYCLFYDPHGWNGVLTTHVWTFTEYIDGDDSRQIDWQIPGPHSGLHHINITRDCSGTFRYYDNETLQWEYTWTAHRTSTCFGFSAYPGQAFDNVVVSDPDPPSPNGGTPFPLELVLIGVGVAVALVVIIGVILYRRRTP